MIVVPLLAVSMAAWKDSKHLVVYTLVGFLYVIPLCYHIGIITKGFYHRYVIEC